MPLLDGQSSLDSVTVRISGLDLEIKTWDSYSIRADFLTPTAAFDLILSTNSPSAYNEIFVDGTELQIFVNEWEQMTGTIERVETALDRDAGFVYKISGRDFLGPVVSASIDPKVRISANQTVADFVSLVLAPYGLSKVYIGDEYNYSIVTGYTKGRGKAQTKTFKINEAKSRKETSVTTAKVVYDTKTVTQVVSFDRPDLKKIPLDQLKPKIGDGAMQVIERLLHRLGLQMWAAADGSGVIVDAPDFVTAPIHKLVRHYNGGDQNNVEEGVRSINAEVQPSCVIGVGQSSGADMAKIRLKCIAVNELVSVNPDGSFAPHVQDIIARYPGIKVLPLRKNLIPATDRVVSRRKPVPVFIKDDESKTMDQLAAFTRRKLSERQREYFSVTYIVQGHSYGEQFPYAINTNVEVDDDFLGIHENLWVLGRTFTKSRNGGTKTELQLIKPYTLELGD